MNPGRRGQGHGRDADPFGGQDEQLFLERIRSRLRERPARAIPPAPYPAPAGEDEPSADTYPQRAERFCAALEALGGRALRVRGESEAFEAVAEELAKKGATCALAGGGDWSACRQLLAARGIQLECWDELEFSFGGPQRAPHYVNRWDAGIDWVDYAVAELGSVAVVAAPAQGRVVSLLPPLYVALVRADRLFATRRGVLAHVARRSRANRRPPALTFITGPSRSADIEMDLSIGVHGPGDVLAILVEGGD